MSDAVQYGRYIIEQENRVSGNKYDVNSVSLLSHTAPGVQVRDSGVVFLVDGVNTDDDAVLTVANEQFPASVSESVKKIDSLVAKLDPGLGRHILQPSSSGKYNQVSYALWSRHRPISGNRILRRIQVISVHGKLVNWISDIGGMSRRPVETQQQLEQQHLEPLRFLIDQASFPDKIKRLAEATLQSITAGIFRPFSVIQHGDFWYGNILLDKSWPCSLRSAIPFLVIDWRGANLSGYPFIDMLRYLESIGTDSNGVTRHILEYGSNCNLSPADILHYTCSYAGHLGLNRDEFPFERYLRLIENLIETSSLCLEKVSASS